MHALVMLAALLVSAPDDNKVSDLDKLVTIRQAIESIDKLQKNGMHIADWQKDAVREVLFNEASNVTKGAVTDYEALVAATGGKSQPTASLWDRMSGVVTFVNILWVTGGILVIAALITLFNHYLLALILMVPVKLWELILYGTCSGFIYYGSQLPAEYALYPVLLGCMGLVGVVWLTAEVHFPLTTHVEPFAFFLTIVWGFVAMHYGSHVIGFMAVMAFMTGVGFCAGHMPGVIFFGFEDDEVIPRATLSGFIVLSLHVGLTITGHAGGRFEVFREGMVFMGSLVYFLGILILASKWMCRYREKDTVDLIRYSVMQALCVGSGFAALYFGSVYHINVLLGVGGTLFYIYLLEKYYELPWNGIGWAWSLLGLGGMLYVFSIFAQQHPQYFLFMH